MAATSSAVTGFGAAATDRSTNIFEARSRAAFRDAWLCSFFHFFESSERCSRKSRYQAFFGVELTARALVKRGYPAVANLA